MDNELLKPFGIEFLEEIKVTDTMGCDCGDTTSERSIDPHGHPDLIND